MDDKPIFTSDISAPRYAGFWIRVGAVLLDVLINGLIGFVAGFFIAILLMTMGMTLSDSLADLLGIIIAMIYSIGFNSGRWQATPGKRIVGIYICRSNGSSISLGRAVGRYFASLLSGLLLGIGFLMVAFTRDKTALHDLIADTRVVYGKR